MTLKVRIEGRVQGVGFRAFVASLAVEHDIKGEVWNTRDGAVEAILQSENQILLDEVVQRLHRGPGKVDRVIANPESNADQARDFQITHTP